MGRHHVIQLDRPDAEDTLRELLTVDADTDAWEFDDVDIGTGIFGELVSRGIVEQHNGGYQLADRTAVEAAVTDDLNIEQNTHEDQNTPTNESLLGGGLARPTASRRHLIGGILTTCLVSAFRLVSLTPVYQSDNRSTRQRPLFLIVIVY